MRHIHLDSMVGVCLAAAQSVIVLLGNMSWLRECLDNKVGINGLDKAGNTALYWASHGGHIGKITQSDGK